MLSRKEKKEFRDDLASRPDLLARIITGEPGEYLSMPALRLVAMRLAVDIARLANEAIDLPKYCRALEFLMAYAETVGEYHLIHGLVATGPMPWRFDILGNFLKREGVHVTR